MSHPMLAEKKFFYDVEVDESSIPHDQGIIDLSYFQFWDSDPLEG